MVKSICKDVKLYKKGNYARGRGLVSGLAALAAFLIILLSSDIAIEYMKKGLDLCARVVIPSLFPFMVISELIVSSGIGFRLAKPLARPMKFIFGVSEAGACVYLLGAFCGFPIGAKTAASMYDRGDISKEEFTRLMTFCNNPGSAFIISAVGVSLFGNHTLGLVIYACVIISSLAVGFVGKLFFSKRGNNNSLRGSACTDVGNIGIGAFTGAIQSSASSMLTVCAYVAFFSALVGCLGDILTRAGLDGALVSFIFGFFEISGGVGSMARLDDPFLAAVGCAAVAGWSGLSVHCQIISICSGRGISFVPYFIAKAAQGVVCATLTALVLKFISRSNEQFLADVFLYGEAPSHNGAALLCLVFFAASVTPLVINFLSGVKRSSKKPQKN